MTKIWIKQVTKNVWQSDRYVQSVAEEAMIDRIASLGFALSVDKRTFFQRLQIYDESKLVTFS